MSSAGEGRLVRPTRFETGGGGVHALGPECSSPMPLSSCHVWCLVSFKSLVSIGPGAIGRCGERRRGDYGNKALMLYLVWLDTHTHKGKEEDCLMCWQ